MLVDVAELVVAHLADELGEAAEGDDPRGGVGGAPARRLDAGTHGVVHLGGALGVDQVHRALHQPELGEQVVVGMGEHVDEGVADGEDVRHAG